MFAGSKYDSVEFNLNHGSSDYDVDDNQANFRSKIKVYRRIDLRTNATITIKINSVSNQSITVSPTDSPYKIDFVEVYNLFITNNSGSTAAIKILGVE
jgi:hypothetical protein